MIKELYTHGHDDILCKNKLTLEIQTQSRKEEWNFQSKEEYLSYHQREKEKIERTWHLIQFCKERNIKSILSIGAGESITEITLKKYLPNIEITCTDYDPFICKKLSDLFGDINFKVFDMKKDDLTHLGEHFDLITFFGSAYVMKNDEYTKLFKKLHKFTPRYIYMLEPYLVLKQRIYHIMWYAYQAVKIVFNRSPSSISNGGLVHGYIRDIKEYVRIFKESGFKIKYKKHAGENILLLILENK